MLEEHANNSIFFRDNLLKPCPFCGDEPYMDSCDRIIALGCTRCGYRRSFPGLVQSERKTEVVASYSKQTKEPLEWYDSHAYERAAEEWNKRVDPVW